MDRSSFEASRRARAKQRELEGHPTPGDLAAYHAGRLTDPRKRQVQDHLAVCEDCAVLYDSLIEFEQFQPEPDASGADPSDAAWLRMRERLREEEAAESPAPEEEPRTAVQPLQRRRVPVWQRPVVAWAVAAGLMLCVVGLGLRVGSLQEENRRLTTPPPSSPLVELYAGTQRSADNDMPEATGSNPFIIFYLSDLETAEPEYEGEVVSVSSGKPIIPRVLLTLDDAAVHFNLTQRSLPPGDYVVRLYSLRQGKPLVAEAGFKLLPAEQ